MTLLCHRQGWLLPFSFPPQVLPCYFSEVSSVEKCQWASLLILLQRAFRTHSSYEIWLTGFSRANEGLIWSLEVLDCDLLARQSTSRGEKKRRLQSCSAVRAALYTSLIIYLIREIRLPYVDKESVWRAGESAVESDCTLEVNRSTWGCECCHHMVFEATSWAAGCCNSSPAHRNFKDNRQGFSKQITFCKNIFCHCCLTS